MISKGKNAGVKDFACPKGLNPSHPILSQLSIFVIFIPTQNISTLVHKMSIKRGKNMLMQFSGKSVHKQKLHIY